MLFFLAYIRLGVNTVIIGGESLNSGYSLLGGVPALVQTVVWLRLTVLLLIMLKEILSLFLGVILNMVVGGLL